MPPTGPKGNLPLQPARIRCYHFNQAFTVPFHSPQFKRSQADSVIVRIDCQDGTVGFGESAPRPYVTGENCRSAAELVIHRFAPILFDQAVDSIASLQAVLHRLETDCLQSGISAFTSALGAIDLALLDALERSQRVGPDNLLTKANRNTLRLSVSVPFLPLDLIRTAFPLFRQQFDIAIFKILVSDDAGETYERVRLIRELAGPDSELRLEFNGKMTFSAVRRILKRMASFNVRAVEQPLETSHPAELLKLRQEFDIDVVADESLVTLADAKAIIANQAYTIFNIKVSKCGGLLRSRQIAAMAQHHGIQCQIGTHVGESRILGIAGRRLARSLPNFDCYGGGSEVLFSYLFESEQRAGETHWPPSAHNDQLTLPTCQDLLAKADLIGDTASGTLPTE